jgi:1-pyrroline-5-carboxylate dehydrogenase
VLYVAFKNELTWVNAVSRGRAKDFHAKYERAVDELRSILKESKPGYPNIINGKRVTERSTFDKLSPIDDKTVLGSFQRGTKDDVVKAVKAAEAAFPEWSETDYKDRVKIFAKAADIIRDNKYQLAAAMSLDNGKDRYESIGDVDETIDFVNFYCKEMLEREGYERELGQAYADEKSLAVLKPYGVWAVICPFNFPGSITTGMTTAAAITGNTVVLKPSTLAPLVPYMIAEILEKAGLPKGVVNFVCGSGKDVGEPLVNHPKVEGIVFTGSKAVGYDIVSNSIIDHPRPVIAEMGSKNPVIITMNADFEKAIDGVVASAFGYGGQKCSAASRLLIDKDVAEEFLSTLALAAPKLKVGDPTLQGVDLGPVIERKKVDDYLSAIALGKKDGKLLCGGRALRPKGVEDGYYVEPSIISGLKIDHWLMQNELFLPVLCCTTFDGIEDALAKANTSSYGLTAGIFTEDEQELDYFFHHIQSGVVYANRRKGACTGAMVGAQPFVGWKASGSTGKGTGAFWYLPQFLREQVRTVALEMLPRDVEQRRVCR